MRERIQCEFRLLRYVPDAVKDEFVNIGVLLRANDGKARVRFTGDWSRVRCLDPAADLEMLEGLRDRFTEISESGGEKQNEMLKLLEESFSNAVQLSDAKACLAESPDAEMELLARMYLESTARRRIGRVAGARQKIVNRMRQAFQQAEVWGLMWHAVPAAKYGQKGDPLRFDCGYQPDGVVRMFHGLALGAGVEGAKSLALSAPAVRRGIVQSLKAETDFAAIVDTTDRSDDEIAFALDVLAASQVRIVPVGEIVAVAELARRELL
jgi:hypothetical protein